MDIWVIFIRCSKIDLKAHLDFNRLWVVKYSLFRPTLCVYIHFYLNIYFINRFLRQFYKIDLIDICSTFTNCTFTHCTNYYINSTASTNLRSNFITIFFRKFHKIDLNDLFCTFSTNYYISTASTNLSSNFITINLHAYMSYWL